MCRGEPAQMLKGGSLTLSNLILIKPSSRGPVEDWCRYISALQGAAEQRNHASWPGERSARDALWETDPSQWLQNTVQRNCNPSRTEEDFFLPPQTISRSKASSDDGFSDWESSCRVARDEEASRVGLWSTECEERKLHETVEALDRLVSQGSSVPASLFSRVLKRCTAQKDGDVGRLIHVLTLKNGYQSNKFLASHIIRMYASHGNLQEAAEVFTRLDAPSPSMWFSIISAHAEHNQPIQAIRLYQLMRQSPVKPSNHVFVAALKSCATAADLASGKQIHADVLEGVEDLNVYVGSSLIDMYAKCGSVKDARRVFDSWPTRNVVMWNTMLTGYAQHGLGQEALSLYSGMQKEGTILADPVTYVSLLKACSSIGGLRQGKELHSEIQARGLESDLFVGNSLVDMYAKCGSLKDAYRVFEGLHTKDVVTWNAMLAAYAQHGLGQEALNLYASMQLEGISSPNKITLVCLLKASAGVGALNHGKQLHSEIREKGLETDVVVGSSLVDMYAKCGSLVNARSVFDRLPTKNVVTWTAMITGYAQQGLASEALALYESMQQEGITPADHVTFVCLLKACASMGALREGTDLHWHLKKRGLEANMVVANSLVDMYAKCGSLEDARRVFDKLPLKDVVTWTTMITGYAQHGLGEEALKLYASMQQEGWTPADRVTFVCLLKACASIGALRAGQAIHLQIQERGIDIDAVLGNCLVDMYAKCGSLEDAHAVFKALQFKDVVTWTTMIAGYSQQGLGQEALDLYTSMQEEGLTPADLVTYVCLLKACASIGALHQGKQIHARIQERGLEGDAVVGSSLVDMYAKCGSLKEAQGVFESLQSRNVVTWTALLNGYGQHKDGRNALQCFRAMQQQGVQPNDATFICLLAACSHEGLVKEGRNLFKTMEEDYNITPSVHHYNCMANLLSRSGHLDEAEKLLRTMPFQNAAAGWTSLLTACKSYGDMERARRCFDSLVEMDPQNAAAYVLLASIYGSAGRWKDVDAVEKLRKAAGARKKPAKAWIEVNRKAHGFTVGEEREDISSKLSNVNLRLKQEGGHVPHAHLVLKPLSDSEKEDALCGHAEKLALAYGLLNTPDGTTLLVTKNLRMCDDCHSGTKIMSRIEKREIIVRDAHSVHHFVDGFCSCGDNQ